MCSVLGAVGFAACSFPSYGFVEIDPLARICTDNLPSVAETDIDCGGGCPPCAVGKTCRDAQDCASGSCIDGLCHVPTCDDHVQNAGEADIDCGGPCTACPPGGHCQVASDCAERVCAKGFCQVPLCGDGVQNGTETGQGCGGECGPCGNGSGCTVNTDCNSMRCSELVCVAQDCTDTLLNNHETDLNCGGPDCSPCAADKHCVMASDCQSSICMGDACTSYSCTDHVLNGDESASDCGGKNCAGCAKLLACRTAQDCASGVCVSGLCVPKVPTGESLPRTGWSAKSSDTYPDDDPNEVLDSVGGRWTSGAYQKSGMWFEVDMGKLETFFSVVLTCGEAPADAPAKFDVYLSTDGKYGDPAASGLYGGALSTASFDTARLARFVKIVLTQDKQKWWSINEFLVKE